LLAALLELAARLVVGDTWPCRPFGVGFATTIGQRPDRGSGNARTDVAASHGARMTAGCDSHALIACRRRLLGGVAAER